MFDIDKWTEIFSTIARNKLRTILTALGVFWGIMMLVLLLGAGNGLRNGVENQFSGFAYNSIYVWPEVTTVPYKGLKQGRVVDFRNADIEALKHNVPEVSVVSPRLQLGGWRDANVVSRNNKYGNFQVMGDHPEYRKVEAMKIKNGRYINTLDIAEKRKICVIGEQVLAELFKPEENPIGGYIKIKGVYFQVVGVFKSAKARGENADRDRRTIYVPFTTFQQAFNLGDKLHWFALLASPGTLAANAEKKVKTVLAARHHIAPTDNNAMGSFNAEDEAKKYLGLFQIIQSFVWAVGLGSLMAGTVGVSNIMLIVVNERTKEIGIRKALGAVPASIIGMIMQESVFLTFIAGYSGLVVGVGILEAVSYGMSKFSSGEGMFFLSPGIQFDTALLATGILMVAGMLAGLMPATKAVQINPIAAIRSE